MTRLLGAEHVEALKDEINNSTKGLSDSIDRLNKSTTILYSVMIGIILVMAGVEILKYWK